MSAGSAALCRRSVLLGHPAGVGPRLAHAPPPRSPPPGAAGGCGRPLAHDAAFCVGAAAGRAPPPRAGEAQFVAYYPIGKCAIEEREWSHRAEILIMRGEEKRGK